MLRYGYFADGGKHDILFQRGFRITITLLNEHFYGCIVFETNRLFSLHKWCLQVTFIRGDSLPHFWQLYLVEILLSLISSYWVDLRTTDRFCFVKLQSFMMRHRWLCIPSKSSQLLRTRNCIWFLLFTLKNWCGMQAYFLRRTLKPWNSYFLFDRTRRLKCARTTS